MLFRVDNLAQNRAPIWGSSEKTIGANKDAHLMTPESIPCDDDVTQVKQSKAVQHLESKKLGEFYSRSERSKQNPGLPFKAHETGLSC
jgi:hypothetical protein